MARNLARASGQKAIPKAEAQARVIDLIQEGHKVSEATAAVGRSEETYRDWMRSDPEFKAAIQSIRSARHEERTTGRPTVPDFETFCRDYLHQPLFDHQLRILDVIEGREPRDMHPSMNYLPGYQGRVVINVPPDHGKSTTFTENYVVWAIHKNPDIRVAIFSQTQKMAKNFLYAIKQKLTSPIYRDMHMRFAPEGGWRDEDNSWTADRIYVRGKGTVGEAVERDPTVQALGLGGQIYGARLDIVIMDDTITTKNAREIDKQMMVLDREIESRLPPDGGLLAILGTRVAPRDLYRSLMEVEDADGERVWTYFRMPAVLDYGDGGSETWTTLWPERWPGKKLARRRREGTWNLIYQQLNINEDMTFRAEAVDASVNMRRFPGPMTEAGMGHREGGMKGLYVVGGLDPATVGNTAMIVAGFDPESNKRYVLDGFNKANCPPHVMRENIKRLTDIYHINEWVIERNAFQRFLTQDDNLVSFLRSRGCKLTEHYTTDNKRDADWGIQTMAPLFDSCGEPDPAQPSGRWKRTPDKALIELPCPRQNTWVNELIQQLTIWQPQDMNRGDKTDLVMALWFTHIALDKQIRRGKKRQTHMHTAFTTQAAKGKQTVIKLSEIRAEREYLRTKGIA